MPPDLGGPSRSFSRNLRLKAEECEVRRVLQDIRARMAGRLSPDDAGSLELALAEVLNNIVEHAFAGRAPGLITVSLTEAGKGDALLCRVEDDGLPMPGMTLPEGHMQPVAERIGDMAEGGWGWALIRTLTEEIVYERRAGHNRLHFRLPLSAGFR